MTERADNPPVAGAAGVVRIETGELTSFSRPDLEDICDAAEAAIRGGGCDVNSGDTFHSSLKDALGRFH